jgi:hypothetical protein
MNTMNMRKWTREEVDYMRENYLVTKSAAEVAQHLNRSTMSVTLAAQRYGLCKAKRFTAEEIDYIYNNYRTLSYNELAEVLGRTAACIGYFIRNHELKGCAKSRRFWSEVEDKVLRENRDMPRRQLSALLNRSENAVQSRLKRLGI